MTQTSIINPEFIFNFPMKMMHSKFPSFCNSYTNHKIDKCMILKSSNKMINIHCCKPIISKTINFNGSSGFDDDDYLDDESINYFIFEMGAVSSNNGIECGSKIWQYGGTDSNGSGRFGASLAPKASSTNIIQVRKSGDAAPETAGHQNVNVDGGNGYAGKVLGVWVPQLNAGSDGEAANTGGSGPGYGNIKDGIWLEGLKIQRYNVDSKLLQTIYTNQAADDFESWFVLAGRIYQYWQIDTGHATIPQLAREEIVPMSPADCWPGSRTVFGHIDGENFTDLNWPHYEWHEVRSQINCVKVFARA